MCARVCVRACAPGVRCCRYKRWARLLGLYLTVIVFAEVGEAVAMKTARGMDMPSSVLDGFVFSEGVHVCIC